MEAFKYFSVTILALTALTTFGNKAYAYSFTAISDLPGCDVSTTVNGISADGSTIVGSSDSSSGREAFQWKNGIMTWLGDLPGGEFGSGSKLETTEILKQFVIRI